MKKKTYCKTNDFLALARSTIRMRKIKIIYNNLNLIEYRIDSLQFICYVRYRNVNVCIRFFLKFTQVLSNSLTILVRSLEKRMCLKRAQSRFTVIIHLDRQVQIISRNLFATHSNLQYNNDIASAPYSYGVQMT